MWCTRVQFAIILVRPFFRDRWRNKEIFLSSRSFIHNFVRIAPRDRHVLHTVTASSIEAFNISRIYLTITKTCADLKVASCAGIVDTPRPTRGRRHVTKTNASLRETQQRIRPPRLQMRIASGGSTALSPLLLRRSPNPSTSPPPPLPSERNVRGYRHSTVRYLVHPRAASVNHYHCYCSCDSFVRRLSRGGVRIEGMLGAPRIAITCPDHGDHGG